MSAFFHFYSPSEIFPKNESQTIPAFVICFLEARLGGGVIWSSF
jgi:hypothetical protein